MIYAIIALIASLLGACCGLGGGVIIKPLLDAFTDLSASSVSLLSTLCVLTIALTSVIKYALQKAEINFKQSGILGIGAAIGGILGTYIFTSLIKGENDSLTTVIQSVSIALLLTFSVLYMAFFKDKFSFKIKNPAVILLAGLALGTFSSFLGIGGGPINVAVVTLLFSLTVKEAAVSSLVVILFAQVTKIASLGLSGGITGDLSPLLILLPVALIGAIIGAWLNKRLNEKFILWTYNITVCALILVSVYNAVTG